MLQFLVISVELTQDRFYHLDTCFCPLDDEIAIWFPPEFDEYGQKTIRHRIPNLIEVVPEEAQHFACNAVVIGKNIVLAERLPAT